MTRLYRFGGEDWINSTDAAQLAGCNRHALAMRRHRAKKFGKAHPAHVTIGSETLYLASAFNAYVASGEK